MISVSYVLNTGPVYEGAGFRSAFAITSEPSKRRGLCIYVHTLYYIYIYKNSCNVLRVQYTYIYICGRVHVKRNPTMAKIPQNFNVWIIGKWYYTDTPPPPTYIHV